METYTNQHMLDEEADQIQASFTDFNVKLKALSDEQVYDLARSVRSEFLHPDQEMAVYLVEGKFPADWMVEAICAEEDYRSVRRRKNLQMQKAS